MQKGAISSYHCIFYKLGVMIAFIYFLAITTHVVSEPLTKPEARAILYYHNWMRSKVEPTAKNMKRLVFTRIFIVDKSLFLRYKNKKMYKFVTGF